MWWSWRWLSYLKAVATLTDLDISGQNRNGARAEIKKMARRRDLHARPREFSRKLLAHRFPRLREPAIFSPCGSRST